MRWEVRESRRKRGRGRVVFLPQPVILSPLVWAALLFLGEGAGTQALLEGPGQSRVGTFHPSPLLPHRNLKYGWRAKAQ